MKEYILKIQNNLRKSIKLIKLSFDLKFIAFLKFLQSSQRNF